MINCSVQLFKIGSSLILLLPQEESKKLPSRGLCMVKGTLNGHEFVSALEPDGRGSHWMKITDALSDATGATDGDTVDVTMESTKDWPEPEVPTDVQAALKADPEGNAIWEDITPLARWDWLRWINSTGKDETRKIRIEKTLSKMKGGTRQPCCFNRALCCDLSVSKGGALLEPDTATS